MVARGIILTLRLLLQFAVGLIVLIQAAFLPWLSGVMAADLPAEAFMRWPILTLAILGLGCVQIAMICTYRLLGFTRDGQVFSPSAYRWVDGIIVAFVGAGVVCLATIVYHTSTIAGPPLWMLALITGVLAGTGGALLMWVMRMLLVQATTLHTDLELVI